MQHQAPELSRTEANTRLTSSTALVLLVLLAVEGITIARIFPLLKWHIFFGMLLVPPILVKIGSTGYRFAKYYLKDPEFKQKGPPVWLLRALGPFEVALTIVLFASGIALIYAPSSSLSGLLFIHKASFVLWFGATTIHVLGHLRETFEKAPLDWVPRGRVSSARHSARRPAATPRPESGTGSKALLGSIAGRRWVIISSLVLGAGLGIVGMGRTASFLASRIPQFH